MKIKVRTLDPWRSDVVPEIIDKGDWIDIKIPEEVIIKGITADTSKKYGETEVGKLNYVQKIIPLGIAMKLPKGFEANIVLRSSAFAKYGILQTNAIGIIDGSYCGNFDEWKESVIGFKDVIIPEGARICQFRIQLSQKATFWQKLRWLLSSKIRFEKVPYLENNNRGGFGSTGV